MGVVPKDTPFLSNQSCKSVCPLAIAKCKEDSLPVTLLFIIIRENLKKLIVNINKQKDALKKNGITVDGVHYAVRFKGKFHIIINKSSFLINLCALHCELRNTEQLLSSLGLFSYKVGSLDECNDQLANYGPENFSSRITVKMKDMGQETAVEKHNIQVSSFSGSTEREFLTNIETIVRNSLPHDKLNLSHILLIQKALKRPS
ncbi:unnamed protein product [Porites lobata]|uniref:Uncharacterized protein n=1 Tax=Porites lobata TaxID=104759 RepID=A0ABN8RWR9_9CNID|nr:unnamed protein product [Porites lobata]